MRATAGRVRGGDGSLQRRAHGWERRLPVPGRDARLIAADFVSPYRMEGKSGKDDMTDAAAVCEVVSRPTMRFVPIRTAEQQGVMALHRVREVLKEERTACINRIRGVLSEFDLVFGKSYKLPPAVLADVIEDASNELPVRARLVVQRAFEHWQQIDEHLKRCDRQIGEHVRGSEGAQRAARINGIGEIGVSVLTAGVGDLKQFKGGHQWSAWMGRVPGQNPSGGKTVLGRITKRGDDCLRTLLIQGGEGCGDECGPRRRPHVAVASATRGPRGVAKGVRDHGQQKRADFVGGDDARAGIRCPARQRQAPSEDGASRTDAGTQARGAKLRGLSGPAATE